MTKTPSVGYDAVVKALQRDGWVIVRQKGSHIRMRKHAGDEILKLTIPAHKPIKRSTLSHIIKQARMNLERMNCLMTVTPLGNGMRT
jgi:predicted RNA binding protein YcfA (HicA-like mRNA interferase family)